MTFKLYSDDTCETLVTTLGPVAIGTVTDGKASVTSPGYTGLGIGRDVLVHRVLLRGRQQQPRWRVSAVTTTRTSRSRRPTRGSSTVAEATDDTLPGTSVKDTANLTGLSADAGGR